MRAIDGDALQEKLTKKKPGPANARYTEGFNDALLRFKSMIHAAPTIKPERIRAKWIVTTSLQEGQITWRDYKCSNCSHHRGKPMNFCEVCGAIMER